MQNRILGAKPLDRNLMATLVIFYRSQGNCEWAAQLGKATVEMQKQVLGAEHPRPLLSMQKLASSYNSQSQYKQAAQLGEQTMEVQKRVLGLEPVDTLKSMSNLTLSYLSNGQYSIIRQRSWDNRR